MKTVVITGSGRGLGFEMAKVFRKNHFNVVLSDLSEENLLNARLSLCCAVKITLKNALTILNISAPEEM